MCLSFCLLACPGHFHTLIKKHFRFAHFRNVSRLKVKCYKVTRLAPSSYIEMSRMLFCCFYRLRLHLELVSDNTFFYIEPGGGSSSRLAA